MMTDSEKIEALSKHFGQIIAQSDALGNIKVYCTFYSGDIGGFKEKIKSWYSGYDKADIFIEAVEIIEKMFCKNRKNCF